MPTKSKPKTAAHKFGHRPTNKELQNAEYRRWLHRVRCATAERGGQKELAKWLHDQHPTAGVSLRTCYIKVNRLFNKDGNFTASGPLMAAINEWLVGREARLARELAS
jgi:hypothetical protein